MKKSQSFSQALFLFRANALLIITLAFSLAAVQPASAQGNTVGETVWYVTTTGNDANSCSAIDAPCLTINGAIGKAADGDTVKVAVGTYTGTGDIYSIIVLIDKNITLLGGWHATFTTQSGISIIDGQKAHRTVYINSGVTVTMERFNIQGGNNYLVGGGITIDNNSVATIKNSTISENIAQAGGGISVGINATLNLNNSTVARNKAFYSSGGGINVYGGSMTILNSTIANNNASTNGGGINVTSGTAIILNNSILANNTAVNSLDCSGTISTSSYNIISNTSGCTVAAGTGDQFNISPLLSTYPVGNFGYHALLSGSPAINTGNPVTCLSTDQRGVSRPQGAVCDIGAYEYTAPSVAASFGIYNGSNQRTAPNVAFTNPLSVYVVDSLGSPVSGVSITFTAPALGASSTFTSSGTNIETATTNDSGIAISSTFTANNQLGSYVITAEASGLAGVVSFALTNVTWFVSLSGTDANTCASAAAPCLTINGAIGKAAAGDTVKVAIGTYTAASGTEVVLVNKSITLSGGWDETFATQGGMSVIDGQDTRRGITVNTTITAIVAIVDRFTVTNGFNQYIGGGGIYNYQGNLTVSNSNIINNSTNWSSGGGGGINNSEGNMTLNSLTISNNHGSSGGGIQNNGTLTINATTISENIAGFGGGGGGGGGGIQSDGIMILNNSIVNNNSLNGSFYGSGIYAHDTITLNNSTVSGNTGGSGDGISTFGGTIFLNNSTISFNESFGFTNEAGYITMQNSIIAANGSGSDCYKDPLYDGTVNSLGYNLIGNKTGCVVSPTTGDIFGTKNNPVDAKLGPLQNNGGPTFTHALLGNSPALNAGSPAAPGSGGNACLPTDQRGIVRPQDSVCDIGAYEGYLTAVISIARLDPNPTSASNVNYLVTFTEPVTGVDSSDFALAATGTTGASITSVSGTDDTYTVTVNTGSGNGNGAIRLKLIDNDSILDSSSNPLGGAGAGNGNFTTGEVYTLRRIPTAISPTDTTLDETPTYKWSKLNGATKYQYQLLQGATVIYTKTVPVSACGVSLCANTPTTALSTGAYKWRIRSMIGGVWMNYSPYKSFVISPAKSGFWSDQGVEFYITNTAPKVDNFAIYIYVNGCGSYKITHTPLVPIAYANKQFNFAGSFYANGTFITPTTAQGTLGLSSFYISGCGYLTGGPFSWTATWKNGNQPTLTLNDGDIPEFTVSPESTTPFELFTIDPEK
ncbi:MAG: right-handed parallel beta-helix repeat-containing protein [Chloroflexi bacterium]|nr:right-handed parallel beta-helix repeat-containing protein [Chloroflexota bacterium]